MKKLDDEVKDSLNTLNLARGIFGMSQIQVLEGVCEGCGEDFETTGSKVCAECRAAQILNDENQAKWESGKLGQDQDSAVRVTVDGFHLYSPNSSPRAVSSSKTSEDF